MIPPRPRGRRWGWLVGLGLLILAGWWLQRRWTREDLGTWLRSQRGSAPALRFRLAPLGDRAVPVLVECLTWRRPAVYDVVVPWAAKLPASWARPLERILPRDSAEVNADAAYGLQLLGPEARPALPIMLSRAEPASSQRARDALEAVLSIAPDDPEVAQLTVRWLADPLVRLAAVRALSAARVPVAGVVPGLEKALAGTNEVEVAFALRALTWQGASEETAALVPELLRWLGNPVVRRQAMDALIAVAPAAGAHRAALLRQVLRQYPPPFELLIALGTNARPAQALVEPFLKDRSLMIRAQAAAAHSHLTGWAEVGVSNLVAVLRQREDETGGFLVLPDLERRLGTVGRALDVRQAAAWFLGGLGSRARAALPALRAAFLDEDRFLALLCAQAVSRMARPDDELLAVVREALESVDPGTRAWAVVVAGELGRRARELEPELERAAAADTTSRRLARALMATWSEPVEPVEEPGQGN